MRATLVVVALAVAAPVQQIDVPVPRSGAIEVAVVHFAKAGATFRLSGTGSLPGTAAAVTGVAGRTAIVAIVDFRPRRSTAAASVATGLRVASDMPFRVDYLGPVANGCGTSGICPATVLGEIEKAQWWRAGPGVVPPARVEPTFRTEAGLLAQVVDALIGVPSGRFLKALAGGPNPATPKVGGAPGTVPASTAAPGLTATASLSAGADGSVTLRVQNTGLVPITSVSLQGIDFTPTALAPPAGASCRLAAPGMVCDAGFAIAPGQSLQFTVASYACCLIGGDVWVNDQSGTSGQYGPITAAVD